MKQSRLMLSAVAAFLLGVASLELVRTSTSDRSYRTVVILLGSLPALLLRRKGGPTARELAVVSRAALVLLVGGLASGMLGLLAATGLS